MTATSNALVTGPPGSGKTTALERSIERLREDGYAVGGLSCPERRRNGERVGFEIVDVASGDRAVMAHVDYDQGPRVGSYRVDVSAVDRLSRRALSTATDAVDCLVIDEIAPMQLESDRFVRETRRALESATPVLAAIKHGSTDGFCEAVRNRADTELFAVEPGTRDALPGTLAAWVESRFRSQSR
ncbi:DUF2478 domain-containing protein [Natronorubrum sp. JWXQ-INN-674]|uniref:Nucleoside-triphosphatase GS429_07850 n=1 Tax=Natronorubrum halalkaliphilum TaxID=2691917 RepID=A0A6B0VJF9_9EURY|nr:nucleoside-triphosphatase [Natronorubrum halalkaliphilum]MXV61971.1 DUF2478 domain-containing protein [Natronorubrum halalkaliphilum]